MEVDIIKFLRGHAFTGLTAPVWFLVFFFSNVVLSLAVLTGGGLGGGGPFPWVGVAGPRSGDWYYSLGSLGGAVEHDVLWLGIGPSISHARNADVIFVGSSLMAGLDWRTIRNVAMREGFKTYSLAVSWDYSPQFAESILNKYQIYPKLLILDAGIGAFVQSESEYAKLVKGQSFLSRLKLVLSKNVQLHFLRIKQWLAGGAAPSVVYRSAFDGGRLYDYIQIPSERYPVKIISNQECQDVAKSTLNTAREFVLRMAQRGTRVVFTRIPEDDMCELATQVYSSGTNTEYVALDWRGLFTTDHHHVVPQDMIRVTEQLMEGLLNTTAFKDKYRPIEFTSFDAKWSVDFLSNNNYTYGTIHGMRQIEFPASGSNLPSPIRWATDPVVTIKMSQVPLGKKLQLLMNFRPYFQSTRHIDIFVNNSAVVSQSIDNDDWQEIRIPLPDTRRQEIEIRLEFDSSGTIALQRQLQMLFKKLVITEVSN